MTEKKSETWRPNPTLPLWMRPVLEPDIEAMGVGNTNFGGAQRMYALALMAYAALPEEGRRELAMELDGGSRERAAWLTFEDHWIGKGIMALAAGGPRAADHLSQWNAAQQRKRRSPDTPKAARQEPASRNRKSERGKGAA